MDTAPDSRTSSTASMDTTADTATGASPMDTSIGADGAFKGRVNATSYPRVWLGGDDRASVRYLGTAMNVSKMTPKGTDPSYRQHVAAIDAEKANLVRQNETGAVGRALPRDDGYAEAVLRTTASVTPRTKAGMFTAEATGPMPLTKLTPELMKIYQNMHYKNTVVKEHLADTQSTRSYESQYLERAQKALSPEAFRAFLLPAGSAASPNQHLMLNDLGASLDVNVPAAGGTVGSGIVNKAVYKHFQKAVEDLNRKVDQEDPGIKGNSKEFEIRTRAQIQHLRDFGWEAMLSNEKENSRKTSGSWQGTESKFKQTRDEIVRRVNMAAEGKKLPAYPVKDEEERRIVGTTLGLMVKVEKRILINHAILGSGTEGDAVQILANLRNLGEVEANINRSLGAGRR